MERATRQRDAIHTVLLGAGRPLSVQEIHKDARQGVAAIGVATVYRTVKALIDEGIVTPVVLPGEAPRYEIADRGHHHHFQCRHCERVFDIEHCEQDFAQHLPKGFSVDAHDVTLYGRCADCRR